MKRHTVMTTGLLAFALFGCDAREPDVTSSTQPIVGGEDVEEGAMPYMVALFDAFEYEDEYADPADLHFCGGTLIDAEAGLVVTAAHCVTWELDVEYDLCDGDPECAEEYDSEWVDRALPPEWLKVTVGSHALSEIAPADFLPVTEVIVHPGFSGETLENDIALLRIEGVDPETPTPRWLGDQLHDPWLLFPGRMATVAGWGALGEDDGYPDILQSVDVPIFHRGFCAALLEHVANSDVPITASMLCAGRFWGGRDACGGDSGGPLVVEDVHGEPVLAGVVSWGEGCARPFLPGVYANVLHLRPWAATCEGVGSTECERLPEIPAELADEF